MHSFRYAAFVALGLSACHAPPDRDVKPSPQPVAAVEAPADAASPSPKRMVLRTYEVPAGRADQLASVLRRALTVGEDRLGTVRSLDDGRLVVTAPDSVHDGVAALCEDFRKGEPAPAPATVEFDYWLVLATPGETEDAAALPSAIEPALHEIVEQQGPTRFAVLEQTRLASLSNSRGEARGGHARFKQLATVQADKIVADIEIEMNDGPGKLDTRVSMTPGQLVVLGQGSRQLERKPAARDEMFPSLYYIVRSQIRPR